MTSKRLINIINLKRSKTIPVVKEEEKLVEVIVSTKPEPEEGVEFGIEIEEPVIDKFVINKPEKKVEATKTK